MYPLIDGSRPEFFGSAHAFQGASSSLPHDPVRAVPYVGEERREPHKRRFRGVAHKLRLAITDLISPSKNSNNNGSQQAPP